MSRSIGLCVGLLLLVSVWACSPPAAKPPTPPEQAAAPPATTDAPASTVATATAPSESETPATAESESPANAAATASSEPAADPEAVLRRVAEFYQQAQSLQVESDQVMAMTGPGMNNTMTSSRTIVAERPNRIAIRSSESMTAFDFVSDGQELSTYVPALQKYSVSEAPQDFDSLLSNPLLAAGMMGGQSSFAVQLLAADPYARMMEGVTESESLGTAEVGGVRAHHLRFIQDQFDWDLWVPVEGDAVILQVATDMSKALGMLGGGNARLKDLKVVSTETFRDWKFNDPVDAVAFTFSAPAGVEKVDNLFGGGGGDEELSPLLGQPAPPVELALLDGGSLNLASHAGESIVMLDFWATWCGPCVQEMPILIKVAEDYRDKGVVLYAVNQAEEPDEIKAFLEEQELSVTVALDSESAMGDEYGVRGIPMLILIDKQGTVQSVHVGFSPGLEATLRKELDDLLAGKNLAEEKIAAAKERQPEIQADGLEETWSAPGRFTGVAVDRASGTIYAITRRGQVKSFDAAGQEQSSFAATQPVNTLRSARLLPGSGSQLLGFRSWGDTVVAMNSDGNELWSEVGGTGIDDVWAADIDGDGQDEVLIGYNGNTGLHVFGADGARRWKYTDIGNVWHVTAGDVTGDSEVEVVATSAAGQVHLFDAEGQLIRNLEVPLYANMVRVGRASDSAKAAIIVSGSGNESEAEVIAALDGDGTVLWQQDLPLTVSHCDSLEVASGAPWVAAGLRGGLVMVFDDQSGEVIALASELGEQPAVTWSGAAEGGAPLLLVAGGQDLKAFRVVPKAE